ncbi:Haloacid Dehalogenase Superfamily Class (subfamily) IIA [Thermomonospora echinospora]|uniref:Haloacid Dehalogenase Superfamily Class (Subfamily) IIA n=1 Tax=Thermomonospora echinospora TaxID=1992 RepID=A0A1H6BU58_9ACTN|nr:HAD-IIA family hydrolase [Thermomonospora echinospora]SEG64261.1 Haloacid Dehalogenase Superfamily Class (subfamily) IIA [Thermomonospora echinospora]
MRECERPLSEAYDVALLDLDGVVYVGHRPVPGAAEALAKARAAGQRLAFVTNNASRTPSAVAALLTRVGVPATAQDVVTSAQAAARLLAERLPRGSRVLVVGGSGLRQALYAQGLVPVSTAAERPAAVVQGYDPNLSYGLIAQGAQAVARGALFVGSNGDLTIPGGDGPPAPGNGSLMQVIRAATGVEPVVTGKPERPLHQESIIRTGAERPLVVGDRLDTDIEGAHNGGADSLLVFTGVTDPLTALTAGPRHRPSYLAADLGGLLVPHPPVRRDGQGWHCRGWTARWTGAKIELTGEGDPYDGLRALCAAAWRTDEPVAEPAVAAALARLGLS